MKLLPFFIVLLFFVGGLFAHESRPAYLQLDEVAVGTYEMTWKVPARTRLTKLELSVQLPDDTQVITPAVSQLVEGAILEQSLVHIPEGLRGRSLEINGLAEISTEVLVRIEGLDGRMLVKHLVPGRPRFTVPADPAASQVARLYTRLGCQHIWEGPDHLLFVFCLMLLAKGRRKLIAAVTGFTIAHSLTLALSVLGVVRLPMPPVEVVIALSILFLAVEIARGQHNTLAYRYPVLVSSLIGLLHGLGFASALVEIGLPASDITLALLFFNVGVEVGQVLFIIVVLVSLAVGKAILPVFRDEAVCFNLQRVAIYLIGITSSFWMIERLVSFF